MPTRTTTVLGQSDQSLTPADLRLDTPVLVDPSLARLAVAVQGGEVPESPTWRLLLRTMRPHQWVKNLLLFVPLLAGHVWGHPDRLLATAIGVAAFSLLASAAYIWNDLLDLTADRAHPTKRFRQFASGQLTARSGWLFAPILAAAGLSLAALVGWPFLAAAAVYLTSTLAYSLKLKREPVIDVMLLAGLYMWRVVAGSLTAEVTLSPWLLAFSIFFFLSLALVKRCTELRRMVSSARGYRVEDSETLARLGTTSSYVAVLVLALYIHQPETAKLYPHPMFLWGVFPVLIYWMSRLWLLAGRGELNDDPVLFALRDPASYWCAAAMILLALAAIRLPL